MPASISDRHRIKFIARESLDTFSKVAESAKAQGASSESTNVDNALAHPNTWTSPGPAEAVEQIQHDNVRGYNQLAREPAIARVVVIDEDSTKATYYICRTTPKPLYEQGISLASYRSPVGQLAARPVGEKFDLQRPGGSISVKILESANFRPILIDEGWDSQDSVLELEGYGPLTIESLRALLKQPDDDIEITPSDDVIDNTLLERLLDEETNANNVRDGRRRSLITRMDLRDQPVLDQFQDSIFRLPLNSRLLILGPPGTGKTTTLIRRLGQKLDAEFLDEDEQKIVDKVQGAGVDHSQSWVMFTPTELLKLYVKEAFNREEIPAPDDRIRTWTDFRDSLARNEFGILRTSSSGGRYVMKTSAQTLKMEIYTDPIAWFADFDQWQKSTFLEEMRASARDLSDNSEQRVAQLGNRLLAALDSTDLVMGPGVFTSLATVAGEVGDFVKNLGDSSDAIIRRTLNLRVNVDRDFLDDLARFTESLFEPDSDPEDLDDEVEEEYNQPRIGRAGASDRFMRTIRTLARARAKNRNVSASSITGQVIEWLGDRSLPDEEIKELGKNLLVQSAMRRFVNPIRLYINEIPRRYRSFRRDRQAKARWYPADGFSSRDIHPLEVDLILLTMVRSTDDLIGGTRARGYESGPARATLERLQRLRRTQVLVDEATDFSPIQLSCMASIAHPGVRSFFACGDFNQRMTEWGTRSREQMEWAVPNLDVQAITIAYRQSRQLHALARQIADLSGSSEDEAVLPDYAEHDGVPPVLAMQMSDKSRIADWLADRIKEIEDTIGNIPSIAVLVNGEDEVRSVAIALGDALTNLNINVIPCPDGQVRGQDSAVRVFSVEHIKGLEFEAVFFIGIDKLAEINPDLFDKCLYVGATRAATYLGITCEQQLPSRMAVFQDMFGQDWR